MDRPEIIDAGAMHKYAGPSLREERVLEAHNKGLELQVVATDLARRHAKEWRLHRRVKRLQKAAWLLVVLAVLLLAALVVPFGDWWRVVQDAGAGS